MSIAGKPNVFQPISYWATKFAKIWQVNYFHSVLLMCILCGANLLLEHRPFMEEDGERQPFDRSETQGNVFCEYCCDVMSQDAVSVLLRCSAQSRLSALLPCLRCAGMASALQCIRCAGQLCCEQRVTWEAFGKAFSHSESI